MPPELKRFLCRVSGHDADKARDYGVLESYAVIGLLLVVVPLASGWGMFSTLYFGAGFAVRAALPLALLVVVVVFAVDYWISVQRRMRDGFGDRAGTLFMRLALTVPITGVTVFGLMLQFNEQELDDRVGSAAQHAADVKGGEARETFEQQITEDQARLDALTVENTATRTETRELDEAWRATWLTPCPGTPLHTCSGRDVRLGNGSVRLAREYDRSVVEGEATRTANDATIATLNTGIADLRMDADAAEAKARALALRNIGIGPQTGALWDVLRGSLLLWLVILVLLSIDLMVVIIKTRMPVNGFDRDARARAQMEAAVEDALPAHRDFAAHVDRLVVARIAELGQRQMARIAADTAALVGDAAPRRGVRRLRSGRALTALVVVLLLVTALAFSPWGDKEDGAPAASPARGSGSSAGGDAQVIDLGKGATLTVPEGAISGDAEVTATPTEANPWKGHTPITDAVDIRTTGEVVGEPVISLDVPKRLRQAAEAGLLQVAFQSDTKSGWSKVPVDFDKSTGVLSAKMPHFSTWQFWTWDWVNIFAQISQTSLELIGKRAPGADCKTGLPTPEWFNTAAGITNDPGLVVRSCAQGHEGDDALDIQIVNNRPYGLMLSYGGAPVQYGWNEEPQGVAEAIRDAIGETAARDGGGLYLPPLSRASVGIKNPGNGARKVLMIKPTTATIAADLLALIGEKVVGHLISTEVAKQFSDAFKAAAGKECAKVAMAWIPNDVTGQADPMKALISGDVADCLGAVLVNAGRASIRDGMADVEMLTGLSDTITKLKSAARVGAAVEGVMLLSNVADYFIDGANAAVPELGYGFSILAHYTYEGPEEPTTPAPEEEEPETPTDPEAPSQPQTPDPDDEQTQSPTPTTPTTPPVTPTPIALYDNYGTVTTAGTPMCRGNPARPESMPGGRVSQSFVASTRATIDSATVQVDPDYRVNVHATLLVDGTPRATSDAAAAGDTQFAFPGVLVGAGSTVTLTLDFSATYGKIVTVYTVGAPGGSIAVTNTCPDGAPSYTRTDTGLRATIRGRTA